MGAAARDSRGAALDAWLAGLLPAAPGIALAAVGGLGRRECAPHGDVDLVLLHTGVRQIAGLADRLWYPIWDAKVSLDHSVRTVPEALEVAAEDVKVALGLLDVRHLAGDARLTAELRAGALEHWRRSAAQMLPAWQASSGRLESRRRFISTIVESNGSRWTGWTMRDRENWINAWHVKWSHIGAASTISGIATRKRAISA